MDSKGHLGLCLRHDTGNPQVNLAIPAPAPMNTVPFSGTGAVLMQFSTIVMVWVGAWWASAVVGGGGVCMYT